MKDVWVKLSVIPAASTNQFLIEDFHMYQNNKMCRINVR